MHTQPFDSCICESASLNDLDMEKVADFFKLDRVQVQGDYQSGISDQDQLVRFGLMQASHLTFGALLCFGQKPTCWLPAAFTRCIIWRGNDRHSGWLDTQEYQVGLLRQFEASRDFLRKHMRLNRIIDSEGSTQQWEMPFWTLGEALANSLVHREYANRTDGVHVEVFEDRVEISNLGDLPPPLALDLLGRQNVSHPRNPQIANIFYLSGHTEKFGIGIQRIQRLLEEARLRAPEFKLGKSKTFTVVLYRPTQVSNDLMDTSEE